MTRLVTVLVIIVLFSACDSKTTTVGETPNIVKELDNR